MDWMGDDVGLSDNDLERVFKYEAKQTIVVKLVESKGYRGQVWTLQTYNDWQEWILKEVQTTPAAERGLYLVLARREGKSPVFHSNGLSLERWLKEVEMRKQQASNIKQTYEKEGLGEKYSESQDEQTPELNNGGRRLRTLPLSAHAFKLLAQSFHTHGSIARVISRADVPFLCCERVQMTKPAYVYNARTSNVWERDLALSATHFPSKGLTYAIVYGCTPDTEEGIISRLQRVTFEASHPLIMHGIFAELELKRHTELVKSTINKVEERIAELDLPTNGTMLTQQDKEQRNESKREAWLDLTYLRNTIISWNTQLDKLIDHAGKLNETEYPGGTGKSSVAHKGQCTASEGKSESPSSPVPPASADSGKWLDVWQRLDTMPDRTHVPAPDETTLDEQKSLLPQRCSTELHNCRMQEVGLKIKSRIMAIKDENEEKIRDCSIRVDGMAMATQWSHGETNVEIALATNRDSRVMRSIALVTMVFLPGTFFATVFSMTFFDWFGDDGGTRVSKYLWIYILITLLFTIITVGSWYFFVFYRQRYRILKETTSFA